MCSVDLKINAVEFLCLRHTYFIWIVRCMRISVLLRHAYVLDVRSDILSFYTLFLIRNGTFIKIYYVYTKHLLRLIILRAAKIYTFRLNVVFLIFMIICTTHITYRWICANISLYMKITRYIQTSQTHTHSFIYVYVIHWFSESTYHVYRKRIARYSFAAPVAEDKLSPALPNAPITETRRNSNSTRIRQ